MTPSSRDVPDAPGEPPIAYARPEAVVELAQVRRRELESLSERLARVGAVNRARPWSAAAGGLVSVGLGALIAGVPLLSSTSRWDAWVIPAYAAAIAVTFSVAAICGFAARGIRFERADSVAAIKGDLDALLDAYELPDTHLSRTSATLLADDSAPVLRGMRREAKTNRQLLEQVQERGRYWRITDPTPSLKSWKRDRFLLEGDPQLERVYEAGEHARVEIDRIMTLRSLRLLRGRGRLRQDDRLDEAVRATSELERLLADVMGHPAGDGAEP